LGINGLEFVVLALLAVVILGPERLPEYASQLARLVKGLRRMATGAREQLREEVGPELDEVDWRKLDPRQYDPRRIIREALLEDFDDVLKPVSSGGPAPVPPAGIRSAPQAVRLSAGQSAPYDAEAT
jgi:sec-independent protein translocase protein TatB